jgi:hypothetical protein
MMVVYPFIMPMHYIHRSILLLMCADSQWLHSRIEINGYEEYSGTEYRSAGCTEEYKVIR